MSADIGSLDFGPVTTQELQPCSCPNFSSHSPAVFKGLVVPRMNPIRHSSNSGTIMVAKTTTSDECSDLWDWRDLSTQLVSEAFL